MTDEKRIIAERYTLDQLIGRGGMGDVYRGTEIQSGNTVAIKLLHPAIVEENPDIVDRFQREGEALRQLNHPNIVTIITTVEDNGEHFLVMEYISGGSLRDLIDEQARLPIEGVLNVALDLADALTRAHRLHIIHRDIKPDNVLLAEDGTPRLTDFGVAHLGDRTRLTQTGSVIGTYAYLSPEACNGLDLDERADIWSFGIMLFEMLTGRVPFHAGGTAAILTAILTKPAPDITRLRPEIPPALVNLIYRMLEKDRERRIPSVRMVGAELEAIIRHLDTPLRQMVIQAGQEPAVGSRFVTPPSDDDTSSDVPAMERSTPQQTHGFSLFPGPQAPADPRGTPPPPHTPPEGYTGYYTPGGSPMSTAEIAVAQASTRKWQLITLMVIVTVLACSTIAVLALILAEDESGPPTDMLDTTIVVPPVEPGQYMVLVAELEALDEEDRTITRYIRDDLSSTLEEGVAFSSVRIRAYPAAITSQRQADQVAEEYGAAVIVWGSYDDEVVDVNVQVGASTGFPDTALALETIQQSANVRVTMTDTRRESIAPQVLAVLGSVQSATGDAYGMMRTLATIDAVDVTAAPITGDTVAAYTHRYFEHYTTDTEQALIEIEGAIDEDISNSLSHALRSMALHRLGRFDDAHLAAETAARLADPGWTIPLLLMSGTVEDPNEALGYLSQIVALRPDDWHAVASRGALYYIYGQTDLARADLEAAIALEPDSNFPYTFATLLAMSQGRFEDATGYIRTIVQEYPDPDLYARSVRASAGEQDTFGTIVSAFVNLLLGRYSESAERANSALKQTGPVPDLLTIVGLDYCNLGRYEDAEAAYDWALNVAGRMDMPQEQLVFMRLLRVDVLLKQGKPAAANQDLTFVSMAGANPALVERFENGDIGCENFFGSAAMLTSGPTAEFDMVIDPGALEGLEPPDDDDDAASDLAAMIEPVAPDEIMILVAELENVGGDGPHERDVGRFIADDLRETLEDSAPFSNLRIRQYDGIITNDDDARAIAADAGAAVIVWGNYTANLIEVEVQIGSLDSFTYNAFDRDDLERMANIRLHLTSERTESVALNVLAVLDVVYNADGNGFETMRDGAIANVIDVQPAKIMGSGVATYVHHYLVAGDAEADAQVIQQALSLDPGNPILFVYSGAVNQRLGQLDQARRDIDTAKRLGPAGWAMPLLFEAAIADGADVLPIFDQAIAMRPDDWFPLFFRGSIYYDAGREFPEALPLARADLEASIALNPPANFPYIYAALLALREGRLADADVLINTIITEFPDPTYMDRLISATMGASNLNPYSLTLSAFVNLTLGRHEQVITTTDTALEQFPQHTDFYVIRAISHCTLGDHEQADAAFTTAIEQDPTFMLLYLLRGAERFALGDESGAEADLETLADSDQAETYAPYITAVESGDLTCATFLGPDSRIASIAAAASQPAGPADAIEPLAFGETYLVVVAELEALPGVVERDVARFVLDDLERRIEDDILYSQISVQAYPQVITSHDEAEAVAEEIGATVIVWGNYGPDVIELEIALGTLDAFPYNTFSRDMIEQVTNVRVHLTSERRQSVAQEVAGVLALLALADGDEYQWMLDVMILDTLDVTPGDIQGSSAAANTHRAMQLYISDTPAAIAMFDAAQARAGGNPLLYAFRSMAHLRAGDVSAFEADIDTAARLGPENWAMPLYAAEFDSHDVALDTYLAVAALRPDDWFVQFMIGMMYYDGVGDLNNARAALEQSFALQPEANLPYVTAMLVALRQGDIAAAQTYAEIILTEFPDPDLTNRAFNAIYGDTNAEAFTGLYFEAGTNLVLGQYNDVAQSISAALEVVFSGPVVPGQLGEEFVSLSDVFFMQGVAYCNLGDADAALEAYSQAIKFGDFPVAHVMRAQMYETQLDIARADADYAAARDVGGADFEVWVAAAASGAWTCENLLDFDYSIMEQPTDE